MFGWLLKHCSDNNKHPNKNKVVYKDVCATEHKRVADNFAALKHSDEQHQQETMRRYDDLKTDMKEGFKRIENLVK